MVNNIIEIFVYIQPEWVVCRILRHLKNAPRKVVFLRKKDQRSKPKFWVPYKGGHKFFFIFVSIISYWCLDLIL